MSSGHPNYQEADFYADIAAILRTTPQSLVEIDSPQDAGLDSVRLLILSEKWQQRGITLTRNERLVVEPTVDEQGQLMMVIEIVDYH